RAARITRKAGRRVRLVEPGRGVTAHLHGGSASVGKERVAGEVLHRRRVAGRGQGTDGDGGQGQDGENQNEGAHSDLLSPRRGFWPPWVCRGQKKPEPCRRLPGGIRADRDLAREGSLT